MVLHAHGSDSYKLGVPHLCVLPAPCGGSSGGGGGGGGAL